MIKLIIKLIYIIKIFMLWKHGGGWLYVCGILLQQELVRQLELAQLLEVKYQEQHIRLYSRFRYLLQLHQNVVGKDNIHHLHQVLPFYHLGQRYRVDQGLQVHQVVRQGRVVLKKCFERL